MMASPSSCLFDNQLIRFAYLINGCTTESIIRDCNLGGRTNVVSPHSLNTGHLVVDNVGCREIVDVFKNGNSHEIRRVIMVMSHQLVNDPETLIKTLCQAKHVVQYYRCNLTYEARAHREMYSGMKFKFVQREKDCFFVFSIPKKIILSALVRLSEDVGQYCDCNFSSHDQVGNDVLSQEIAADKHGLIQYARQFWFRLERNIRFVWQDDEWVSLVNDMNNRGHAIFGLGLPKPCMQFNEQLNHYYIHPGGLMSDKRVICDNIRNNLTVISKQMLIGNQWYENGDSFHTAISYAPWGDFKVITDEALVHSLVVQQTRLHQFIQK